MKQSRTARTPRRPSWLRGAALVLAGALAVAGLAACEKSEADPKAGASQGAAFPVSIAHKFGSTTVNAKPTRVVTVGWNDQDFVLALGETPVSTRSWFDKYNTYPWVKQATGGKPLPTFSGELNFEAIAKQKPDLILAIYETITKESYDKLTQIAPTVIQSNAYKDEMTPWDVQTLTTGKALGKSAEAQKLVDAVKAKVAAAKAANPAFAGKVLVVDYGPEKGGHYLIGANDPRRALFDALGFAAQPVAGDLSQERLDAANRDVLFVNGATKATMLTSPVFAKLPVVATDRTLYTSFDTPLAGALSYSGPNALMYALDVLVPQLALAADGNPATKVADLSNQA